MVDTKAFRNLSYGLYIISSKKDGKSVGCVINTFSQVTSTPAQVTVAVNKENYTSQGIQETGAYEVAVMNESASMELIGKFGFHSSADTDKFSDFETAISEQGLEYVAQSSCAHFSVKVTQELDLGSHILFIGEVVEAEPIAGDAPMTYAYYHQVKGGKLLRRHQAITVEMRQTLALIRSQKIKNQKLLGVARFVAILNTSKNSQKISYVPFVASVVNCLNVLSFRA